MITGLPDWFVVVFGTLGVIGGYILIGWITRR